MEDRMKFKHESYGQVAIAKCRCNKIGLFGSNIEHDTSVRLTVSKSELSREYSEDSYYPYEKIVEIELSPNQFSDLLTSPNTSGVPCTIRYTDGQYVNYKPPFENGKYSMMSAELENEVQNIENLANQLTSILNKIDTKEKLSASAKQNLKAINDKLKQVVNSNLPFVMKQVKKELDNTVSDALASIEQQKLVKLEGLTSQQNFIEEGEHSNV